MWTPTVTEMGSKYYFFFGANDIHDYKKETLQISVSLSAPDEIRTHIDGTGNHNSIR